MAENEKDIKPALSESERRFEFLVDNLNGMAYRCANDSDWTMEYVSAYSRRLTGYTPGDLTNNRKISYAELIHEDDRERVWREIQQAVGRREAFVTSYRIITAGGEEKHVWEQGRSVFDDNGEVEALEGFITDITERVKLESRLRAQENLYHLLADNTLDIIWRMDRNLNFTYVNPAIKNILGYTPEEFVATNLRKHCNREYFKQITSVIEKVLEEEKYDEGVMLEIELLHKDGRQIPLEVHGKALVDEQGEVVGYQGTSRDITARLQQRTELIRTKEFLEKTLFSLADAVFVIQASDRSIIACNPAVESVFGYSQEELIGNTTKILHVDQEQFDRFQEVGGPVLEQHDLFHIDYQMRRKDGVLIDTENTVSLIRDEDGNWLYAVSVVRDITQAKFSEKQRSELQDQLHQSQKMEAIGRLAGGIAHDFNNLLSVILGYASIMNMELDPGERYHEYVSEINEAGKRAARLTSQLLAFGRKQTLEMKVVDINQLILDFRKLLRRVIGEDVELVLEQCSQPLPVRADSSQLEQVLMNLAVNARDAMPGGGTITVRTEMRELSEETDGIELIAGPHACITFSDTGVGMDEGTAVRVFEPFFSTKERDKGTGLGLATTFGIIKQHAGDISVESAPGAGTTFTIMLPLSRSGPDEDDSSPGAEIGPGGGSGTVLVVEDDRQVLEMARNILARHGYRVMAFTDVDEALLLARKYKQPLDLLLSDVVMPRMKGPELYARLRESHPETKVIYMSGYRSDYALDDDGEDENTVLGEEFIQKPFTIAELLRRVAEVLG